MTALSRSDEIIAKVFEIDLRSAICLSDTLAERLCSEKNIYIVQRLLLQIDPNRNAIKIRNFTQQQFPLNDSEV